MRRNDLARVGDDWIRSTTTVGATLPDVEHRTTKTRTWPAWTGMREDLQRIGALANRLLDARRETLAERYGSYIERARQGMTTPEEIQADVAKYRQGLRLNATLRHGNDVATGDVEDVLKEIDRRTITQLSLTAAYPYSYDERDKLEIVITWKQRHAGPRVLLTIESADIGWANQAMSMLGGEINKGYPHWSVHSPLARLGIGALATLSFWTTIFLVTMSVVDSSNVRAALMPALLGISGWITISATGSDAIYNRVFPPIELKGEDYQSTTGRRVLFFGSFFVSILTGVFVNIIS